MIPNILLYDQNYYRYVGLKNSPQKRSIQRTQTLHVCDLWHVIVTFSLSQELLDSRMLHCLYVSVGETPIFGCKEWFPLYQNRNNKTYLFAMRFYANPFPNMIDRTYLRPNEAESQNQKFWPHLAFWALPWLSMRWNSTYFVVEGHRVSLAVIHSPKSMSL